MILADTELEALVESMNFESEGDVDPFDARTQVQPASIDLRLGFKFWHPRSSSKVKVIDISKLEVGGATISQAFNRKTASKDFPVVLKPGQMVLARTLEKFTIPNGYSATLHGRSSLSRLGLSVHCNGGFMNPGWRGRMPLQLINNGVTPIRLIPQVRICQICIIKTTSESKSPYGSEEREHSYVNDDGGPSRFWTDVALRKVIGAKANNSGSQVIEEASKKIAKFEDSLVIERYTTFCEAPPARATDNERGFLELFAAKDTNSYKWRKRLKAAGDSCGFLFIGSAVTATYSEHYSWMQYLTWIAAVLLAIVAFASRMLLSYPPEPFTQADVDRLYNESL